MKRVSKKRVLSFVGNLIFAAVVLYLCYFIIQAAQNQSPDVFGYRMLRVMTDSMEPVFGSGDCIIVKEVEEGELITGDIITFVSSDPMLNGGFNTHRIIDIAKDHVSGETVYYTKGDNNNWQDDYTVSFEDIIGKYQKKLPYGKTFSAFLEKLSDRNYYFLLVIVPILLCFLSCIIQLVRDIRKNDG